jgi:hypothetical protein
MGGMQNGLIRERALELSRSLSIYR